MCVPDQVIAILFAGDVNATSGGRQTWLSRFLRNISADHRENEIRLFYLSNSANAASSLIAPVANGMVEPVDCTIHHGNLRKPTQMIVSLLIHKDRSLKRVRYSIAPGVFEAIIQSIVPPFSRCKRIVWMRTIFEHETRGQYSRITNRIIKHLENRALRGAHVRLCNGRDIQDYYATRGFQMSVIENGVDVDLFTYRELPPPSGTLDVVYIGRLAEAKGIRSFLSMASKAKSYASVPALRFFVIGSGPLDYLVEEMSRQGVVIWRGAVDRDIIAEQLSQYHVGVALTRSADKHGGGGTSNALLEQMALGLVTVAWDNAMYRQILDTDNAYLVPQDNTEMLLRELIEIASHWSTAQQKARRGRTKIQSYTSQIEFNKFLQVERTACL